MHCTINGDTEDEDDEAEEVEEELDGGRSDQWKGCVEETIPLSV